MAAIPSELKMKFQFIELLGGTETIDLAVDAMLRIAGIRIATACFASLAMTKVFGSFRTYLAASCIEKHVIPRERSDRGNPFPGI